MKRGEWHEAARELASQGMTIAAIAAHFGVTGSAVYKALHPDRAWLYNQRENESEARREAKRRWERENNRGECTVCGARTWNRRTRCAAHTYARDAAWRRRREIADRWNAGETLKEIAAALGTTARVIGVDITRMRHEGWDVPYRYNMRGGRRVAA